MSMNSKQGNSEFQIEISVAAPVLSVATNKLEDPKRSKDDDDDDDYYVFGVEHMLQVNKLLSTYSHSNNFKVATAAYSQQAGSR